MPELSPAAQAVLDAFSASEGGVHLEGDPERIAAALRAAANQSYPIRIQGLGGGYWCYRNGADAKRDCILAIAAELENLGE